MTNTKFRKRALLSSVAMLLVALVALGSATFAWFQAVNHADASPINAKTSKSSNIVVSETNNGTDWTHSLTFALGSAGLTAQKDKLLAPVTTKDFSTWYEAIADEYDKGFSTDPKAKTGAVEDGGYVKHTDLYVKSTTAQSVKVGIEFLKNTGDVAVSSRDKQILRVALVPKTGFTGNYDKPIIWATLDGDALNDRAHSEWRTSDQSRSTDPQFVSSAATGKTVATLSDWGEVNLGAFSADQVMAFDVYVWIEGTDLDCIDSNSGTEAHVKFNFDEYTGS